VTGASAVVAQQTQDSGRAGCIMGSIREVAVSYASVDNTAGPAAGVVRKFCDELKRSGIKVTCALDGLSQDRAIRKSMAEEIGKAKYLCVFFSENFLKSSWCMYELLVAYKHDHSNTDAFLNRVRFFWLFDNGGLSEIQDRLPYVQYWGHQSQETADAVKKMGNYGSGSSLDESRLVQEIANNVDEMLEVAGRRPQIRDYDSFLQAVWRDLGISDGGGEGHGPGEPTDAFPGIIKQINGELAADESILQFCRSTLGRYVTGTKLRQDIVAELHNNPAAFADVLESAIGQLKTTGRRSRFFCDGLQRLLAGLLVLSISPAWVQIHRSHLFEKPIPIPGRQKHGTLGTDRNGHPRSYDWLTMSIGALMDRQPGLERIFRKPQDAPRRIDPPPVVGESIGTSYEAQAIQQHLIRSILKEIVPIPVSSSADDDSLRKQFDEAYGEALRVMAHARRQECDPYHMDPDANRAVQQHRESLKLTDLLLFAHPEGRPSKFLPEHTRKLLSLYDIFDLLRN
jgi:hypothetical protein